MDPTGEFAEYFGQNKTAEDIATGIAKHMISYKLKQRNKKWSNLYLNATKSAGLASNDQNKARSIKWYSENQVIFGRLPLIPIININIK